MKKKLEKESEIKTEDGNAMANFALNPYMNAARIIGVYDDRLNATDQVDIYALLLKQKKQEDASGTRVPEVMLSAQAHALESIFTRCATIALQQEGMKNIEGCLRLGLKAQSQCRSTLETLGHIKNPSIIYAKQANISQGHQQVNNNMVPVEKHTENEKERQNGHRLEQSTSSAAIGINTNMAAMEEIKRSKN